MDITKKKYIYNLYKNIIKKTESCMKRTINKVEDDYIRLCLSNIKSFEIFKDDHVNMSNEIISMLLKNNQNYLDNDTHELLKNILYDDISDNKNNKSDNKLYDVNNKIIKSAYLYLDTKYRSLENDGTEYFKWNYTNLINTQVGSVNSIADVKDIISMCIITYKIPLVSNALNQNERITLSIDELSGQSVIAHENRRFHSVGISRIRDNWIDIRCEDFRKGVFKFNNPINNLNSLTVRFGNPLEPIIFDKDRLNGLFTYNTDDIITITFQENHNLTTGDIIYVENFDTKNSLLTSNTIQKSNGHTITVLNLNQLTIAVDTKSIYKKIDGTVNVSNNIITGNINVTYDSNIITGNNFNTNFINGDFIQINNNLDNPIIKIKYVESNTVLTLDSNYNSPSGTFSYTKPNLSIVGLGTEFIKYLNIGDTINITDNNSVVINTLIIKTINSNTHLSLENPYTLTNGTYKIIKDNSINIAWPIFFGSKRIFIPIEFTYIS